MARLLSVAALTVLATVLGLEALFRCLPVSTATLMGYHADPELLTYPAHHTWAVSTGWDMRNAQQLRSNAQGFAADIDFVPDPSAVALVGDSYVEASALQAADRPAVQLARQLQGRRAVYGMGTPGTALLDYAQRIRFASHQFQTRDFVLWLGEEDAQQSLCGSGHVVSRCLRPKTLQPAIEQLPPPDTLKRLVRHSALAQYVFSQLKLNPGRIWNDLRRSLLPASAPSAGSARPSAPGNPVNPVSPADDAAMRAMVDAVIAEFFKQASPHVRGRLLFVVDGHRDAAPARPTPLDAERRYLLQALQAAGADVLDLEPVFAAHRSESSLSPEIGPYDRHLNAMGVGLVMHAVAARLQSERP